MKMHVWVTVTTACALSVAVVGVSPAVAVPPAPVHAVVGQILRYDGGPVEGLSIHLDDSSEQLWALTDKFGRWEMTPKNATPHVLYVSAYWTQQDAYPLQYYPLAATVAGAKPIDTSAALTRVTFTLRTGTVLGRLIDPSGAAATRATVQLRPTGDPTHSATDVSFRVAADGTFVGIAVAGSYSILAKSLGPGQPESPPKPVTVQEGHSVGVGDLVVPDSGGSVSGTVTDSLGNGVPACVTLYTPTGRGVAEACTDLAGNYLIKQVAAGTYVGTARPTDGIHMPADLNGRASFAVIEGQTVVQNVVVPQGGRFVFDLTDFRGKPAANALVQAWDASKAFGLSATTDAAGHASLNGLPPGAYEITLKPDKQWTDAEDMYFSPVTLAMNQTIAITQQLPASDWVSGELTDNFSGKPVAGVLVYAAEQGCVDAPCYYHFTYTDKWGHYFIHGIEASWPMTYAIGIGGSDRQSMNWTYKPNEGPKNINAQPGLGHRIDFKLIHTFAGGCIPRVDPC